MVQCNLDNKVVWDSWWYLLILWFPIFLIIVLNTLNMISLLQVIVVIFTVNTDFTSSYTMLSDNNMILKTLLTVPSGLEYKFYLFKDNKMIFANKS